MYGVKSRYESRTEGVDMENEDVPNKRGDTGVVQGV